MPNIFLTHKSAPLILSPTKRKFLSISINYTQPHEKEVLININNYTQPHEKEVLINPDKETLFVAAGKPIAANQPPAVMAAKEAIISRTASIADDMWSRR